MMSLSRKAEILAAESHFRRTRDLADRLAESGVYLIGPLHLSPPVDNDAHDVPVPPAHVSGSVGAGPCDGVSDAEHSIASDPRLGR